MTDVVYSNEPYYPSVNPVLILPQTPLGFSLVTQTDWFQDVMLSKAKHLALAKNNRIMVP